MNRMGEKQWMDPYDPFNKWSIPQIMRKYISVFIKHVDIAFHWSIYDFVKNSQAATESISY